MTALGHAISLNRSIAAATLCIALASCGDSGGDNTKHAGESCGDEAQCESPLICPMGGHFAGACTRQCENDNDCNLLMGDTYYCFDGACVMVCRNTCSGRTNSNGVCPAGHTCTPQCLFDTVTCDVCTVDWCIPP